MLNFIAQSLYFGPYLPSLPPLVRMAIILSYHPIYLSLFFLCVGGLVESCLMPRLPFMQESKG
jgi:hypothetical protein